MLAVRETDIAYAKLCEKYFTTKAGQATAAWNKQKPCTQAVSKQKFIRCFKSFLDFSVHVKREARALFFSAVAVEEKIPLRTKAAISDLPAPFCCIWSINFCWISLDFYLRDEYCILFLSLLCIVNAANVNLSV